MYPAIMPQRKSGNEIFFDSNGETIAKLKDFWQWAYSDLIGNAERGAVAEFIVATALGIEKTERVSWDKFDLLSKEGIKIEVKTSGFIQTWEQKKLSKPVFGIAPTLGWNSITNTYDNTKMRQSDVYVFCVHKHTDQDTIDPLDTRQWDFYVLSTSRLNEVYGEQKTATLDSLIRVGATSCQYEMLYRKILSVSKNAGSET